jgi:uncharacterized repeat protein (TIGR03803 family)
MKKTVLPALAALFLAASAFAANSHAVASHTFLCNGSTFGPCPEGGSPNSLIQGSDGNFYGTAANSGSNANGQELFGGTVFSLSPAGKFTLLHTFTAGTKKNFANGATPISLTEGPDGNLYGVTYDGGNSFGSQFLGYGVVFRMSKTGSGFKVIHRLCSAGTSCTDGALSTGSLVAGGDGNVYGVTSEGGTGTGCGSSGCGAIFRVTPSTAAYEVVASFSTAVAGFPLGAVRAADGTLYGLTISGDSLFHFVPASGMLETTSLPFPFPSACVGLACIGTGAFAMDSSNKLHGLYAVYNAPGAGGSFAVDGDGSHFNLFPEFTSTTGVGVQLLLASDGNLWFPRFTGSSSLGDLVALSPTDGKAIKTLKPFNSSVSAPGQIIQAKDGTLWGVSAGGTTTSSGHFANGTVFSVNVGLPAR